MKRAVAEVAGVLVAVACVAFVSRGSDHSAHERQAKQEVAKWKARYAERAMHVQHDVDTVRVYVRRYDTVRSVLNIHDTVEVKAFVAVADSTVRACTALANSCAAFRLAADSTMRAQDAAVDWWRTEAGYYRRRTKGWQIATGVLSGFIVWRLFK